MNAQSVHNATQQQQLARTGATIFGHQFFGGFLRRRLAQLQKYSQKLIRVNRAIAVSVTLVEHLSQLLLERRSLSRIRTQRRLATALQQLPYITT